jgi:hypothetical protein
VQEEETLRAEFEELKRAFEAMEGEIREVKKAKGEDKSSRQQQPGGSLVGLSGFIMRWTAWYIGRYGRKPIDLKFVSHMTSRMPEVCDAIPVQHPPLPSKASMGFICNCRPPAIMAWQ